MLQEAPTHSPAHLAKYPFHPPHFISFPLVAAMISHLASYFPSVPVSGSAIPPRQLFPLYHIIAILIEICLSPFFLLLPWMQACMLTTVSVVFFCVAGELYIGCTDGDA